MVFYIPIICLFLANLAITLLELFHGQSLYSNLENNIDSVDQRYFVSYILVGVTFSAALMFFPVVYLTTAVSGEEFFSAVTTPFRRLIRRVITLTSILNDSITYAIRNLAWTVLQKMILGLEGYRYETPVVDKLPHSIPENLVKLESMPKGAERRALATRNTWIVRHSADVSETFAKMAVTASDVSSLMKRIEEDATLVHGAYYSDDECIAQIANWIARKSFSSRASKGVVKSFCWPWPHFRLPGLILCLVDV